MSVQSILRTWSVIFLLAGGLVLGGYGFLTVQAEIYRARDAARLASLMSDAKPAARTNSTRETAFAKPILKTGSVLGELEIPRLGIDTVVLEGINGSILRRGAGHIPGTAMPDSPGGNVGIAAHRDSYFRQLRFIQTGDLIVLKTPAGNYRYRVRSAQIVEPEDVAVLANRNQSMLTLVTCYPFYYVGPAPHRFIVWATEMSAR